MERTLQIKRRNNIIRDIQDREFKLDMNTFISDETSPLGLPDREKLPDLEFCNTVFCIAGDAARRLYIEDKTAKERLASHHFDSISFFEKAAGQYLGLNSEELDRLLYVTGWDWDLQEEYTVAWDLDDMEAKKAAAIEMLKRVIPDEVAQ